MRAEKRRVNGAAEEAAKINGIEQLFFCCFALFYDKLHASRWRLSCESIVWYQGDCSGRLDEVVNVSS